jgi:hypothetical protein
MKQRVAIGFAWVVLFIAAAGCAHDGWNRYAETPGSTAVDASGARTQTREDYTLIPRGVR